MTTERLVNLWQSMLGDLPCVEIADQCIGQLQMLAIDRSKTLKAINEQIEVINSKLEAARKNNQKTIALGVLEPLVQSYLKLEEVPVQQAQPPRKRGLLSQALGFFVKPSGAMNDVLSLIGVPIFRNDLGVQHESL